MKKNGFTLIELLAVIVVLAVVMVMATTTVLPYMSTAREDAFRLEASEAVNSASDVLNLYNLGEVKITDTDKSNKKACMNTTDKKACFTIEYLIDTGNYKAEKKTFSGKIEINLADKSNPAFTLYFKKNDEFKLINQTARDFSNNGLLSTDEWQESYAQCDCTSE